MIESHFINIQSKTVVIGTEGERTYTWATFKSIVADVQPAQLSQNQLTAWGFTDLSANMKKMFYNKDTSITVGMRAVVDGETYDIRGSNHWPTHSEYLLVPVQGI